MARAGERPPQIILTREDFSRIQEFSRSAWGHCSFLFKYVVKHASTDDCRVLPSMETGAQEMGPMHVQKLTETDPEDLERMASNLVGVLVHTMKGETFMVVRGLAAPPMPATETWSLRMKGGTSVWAPFIESWQVVVWEDARRSCRWCPGTSAMWCVRALTRASPISGSGTESGSLSRMMSPLGTHVRAPWNSEDWTAVTKVGSWVGRGSWAGYTCGEQGHFVRESVFKGGKSHRGIGNQRGGKGKGSQHGSATWKGVGAISQPSGKLCATLAEVGATGRQSAHRWPELVG